MSHSSRHIVGIDLGTTNTAVSFADAESANPKVETFHIPQLTDWGASSTLDLLPSFAFLPPASSVPDGGLQLPWGRASVCVGSFARDFGSLSPSRLVHSAKSWLCHAGVDRRSKILPWTPDEREGVKLSPVEAAILYLDHVRLAWNHAKAPVGHERLRLEDQQVVLTIPASFDEAARELTIDAARRVGLRDLTLVEEPLAAFHAWLHSQGETWKETLGVGHTVLIVDVGGGTTDFSMIELDADGHLARTAAGNHLLLGGDNIDAAIARKVEEGWKTRLPPRDWASLCQRARDAKERILDGKADRHELTLLSQGSSLVAGVRKAMVERAELESMIADGFFPMAPVDSPPPQGKTGIKTMGLPYVSEPAVTMHLLEFLRYAAKVSPSNPGAGPMRPDYILFNGGAMTPVFVRRRVIAAISAWFPGRPPPVELNSPGFRHAVAIGAAAYGLSKRGIGVRVRGGTSKSFYVEVATPDDRSFVCVAPRGMEENTRTHAPGQFKAEANRKVRFPLYSSSTRLNDKPGDVLHSDDGLSLVCDLVAALKFGKQAERSPTLACGVSVELLETGLLKLWIDSGPTSHTWPLHFDIRAVPESLPEQGQVVPAAAAAAATEILSGGFATGGDPASAFKDMEAALGLSKDKWPLPLLRIFADNLLDIPRAALRTPHAESRWLNLLGYCLRPGFGDPADELRLKKLWRVWFEGPAHPNNAQTAADWWVLWRRACPGLRHGHQKAIGQDIWSTLCPKGNYQTKHKLGPQVKAEMWRCLGSLELLDPSFKIQIAGILLGRGQRVEDCEYWVLARIGARKLFHAPAERVVPATDAGGWMRALAAMAPPHPQARLFAAARIGALCGDRQLDLDPADLDLARAILVQSKVPETWLSHLERVEAITEEESVRLLGDALPLGLKIG